MSILLCRMVSCQTSTFRADQYNRKTESNFRKDVHASKSTSQPEKIICHWVPQQQGICRYQAGSETCRRLAQALQELTQGDERELFDFGSRGQEPSPVLLLIDRKEDPVTPLLLQWTYQAMVHELLGIQANRVNLPPSATVRTLDPVSFHWEYWEANTAKSLYYV